MLLCSSSCLIVFGGFLGDTRSEFAPQTGMDGRGGQKIQLESVKETKKRNSFCLIVVRRKDARCHFSFKPMGPTFPDVLIPLELAISACQKKRCPARFAWSRKRNSYKIVQKQSACLIMFAWFSFFVFHAFALKACLTQIPPVAHTARWISK